MKKEKKEIKQAAKQAKKKTIKKILDKEYTQRDKLGRFLVGNTLNVGGGGGEWCTYCERKEEVLKKTYLYIAYCNGDLPDHQQIEIPYLEQLCLNIDILTDTLDDWCRKPLCARGGDHSDIILAKKKIMQMQKLGLLRRTNANNPVGAIFQLKVNHGAIETEKKILAGSTTEPLEIRIVNQELDKESETDKDYD